MTVMYALESRSRHFIFAFALGSALSSSYGFLAGTWPFGIVEGAWTQSLSAATSPPGPPVQHRNV